MPVSETICGGTATPGSTSVANSPTISPPRTLTAPISVIASESGGPPVVSRSTTTNVTADRGVPSSPNESWGSGPVTGRAGASIAAGR